MGHAIVLFDGVSIQNTSPSQPPPAHSDNMLVPTRISPICFRACLCQVALGIARGWCSG
jgi:hypothetical protein